MTTPGGDFTRQLYPFLYPPVVAAGAAAMEQAFAEARVSTLQKSEEVASLRRQLRDDYSAELVSAARAMASRFALGGKLLACGNGGSATDAQDAAVDCMSPPTRGWRTLPAIALCSDVGVVTGIANDVGFEIVYSRQVIALGDEKDILVGFSTSGGSPNVVAAFKEAKKRKMLTIALAGYDGGELLRSRLSDHCFVARLEYVPRIQEGHATVWHALLELVQTILAAEPAFTGKGNAIR